MLSTKPEEPDEEAAQPSSSGTPNDVGGDFSKQTVLCGILDLCDYGTKEMKAELEAAITAAEDILRANFAKKESLDRKPQLSWPKPSERRPSVSSIATSKPEASIGGIGPEISRKALNQRRVALSADPTSNQYKGKMTPSKRPWECRQPGDLTLDGAVNSILARQTEWINTPTASPPPPGLNNYVYMSPALRARLVAGYRDAQGEYEASKHTPRDEYTGKAPVKQLSPLERELAEASRKAPVAPSSGTIVTNVTEPVIHPPRIDRQGQLDGWFGPFANFSGVVDSPLYNYHDDDKGHGVINASTFSRPGGLDLRLSVGGQHLATLADESGKKKDRINRGPAWVGSVRKTVRRGLNKGRARLTSLLPDIPPPTSMKKLSMRHVNALAETTASGHRLRAPSS